MNYLSLEKTPQASPTNVNIALRIVNTRSLEDMHENSLALIHTAQTCEAYYLFKDKKEQVTTHRFEHGYLIDWHRLVPTRIQELFVLHTTRQIFSEPPIWDRTSPLQTEKQVLSLPAFGLIGERWYDAWTVHFSKQGHVLSAIPPGMETRLSIPIEDKNIEGIAWQKIREELPVLEEFQRQCVIRVLQGGVTTESLKQLYVHSFNLKESCCLLLLRQAFPKSDFVVHHPSEKKLWPARFKNFLESLGVLWKQGDGGVNIDSFFVGISDDEILNLVPYLNKKTRIFDGIPKH
jgi:hypothetical protein